MKMRVFKFPLAGTLAGIDVDMPLGAELLHFAFQADIPCVWALVDTTAPMQVRRLRVIGTGWDVEAGARHIGTALVGSFVWHLFELAEVRDA